MRLQFYLPDGYAFIIFKEIHLPTTKIKKVSANDNKPWQLSRVGWWTKPLPPRRAHASCMKWVHQHSTTSTKNKIETNNRVKCRLCVRYCLPIV